MSWHLLRWRHSHLSNLLPSPSYLILCRSLGIRRQTSLRQCWRISSPAFCRRMSPSGLVTCAVVPTTSSPTSGSAPSTGWTCSTGEGLRLSGHQRGVSPTLASAPLATPQQWWRSPTTTSLRTSSKIFDYRAPKQMGARNFGTPPLNES